MEMNFISKIKIKWSNSHPLYLNVIRNLNIVILSWMASKY